MNEQEKALSDQINVLIAQTLKAVETLRALREQLERGPMFASEYDKYLQTITPEETEQDEPGEARVMDTFMKRRHQASHDEAENIKQPPTWRDIP